MKKQKLLSALPFVAMAAYFLLPFGCALGTEPAGGEGQEGNSESALSPPIPTLPPFHTQPGTWKFLGNESCTDMCSEANCNCVPFCPGTPQTGGACQTTRRVECYSRVSKGSLFLNTWTCVPK